MKRVKFKLEFEIDDIEQEAIVNRLFNNPSDDKRAFSPRLKLDELVVSSIRRESSNLELLEVILLPNGKLELIEYSRAEQSMEKEN